MALTLDSPRPRITKAPPPSQRRASPLIVDAASRTLSEYAQLEPRSVVAIPRMVNARTDELVADIPRPLTASSLLGRAAEILEQLTTTVSVVRAAEIAIGRGTESMSRVVVAESPDREWRTFLSGLQSKRARDVRALWTHLRAALPALPVPRAGAVPDDGFQFVWDHGRHHLNIELVEPGQAEWFYLDRATRQTAGEEFDLGDPLPKALLERLADSTSKAR
jgi:hypothetical protein